MSLQTVSLWTISFAYNVYIYVPNSSRPTIIWYVIILYKTLNYEILIGVAHYIEVRVHLTCRRVTTFLTTPLSPNQYGRNAVADVVVAQSAQHNIYIYIFIDIQSDSLIKQHSYTKIYERNVNLKQQYFITFWLSRAQQHEFRLNRSW